MAVPRLEINLEKISHNIKSLIQRYGAKGISISAVTKVVCGNIAIAQLLLNAGITTLADSKVDNLIKMSKARLQCQLLLLGPPMFSQAELIVQYAHISLNTEISVVRELSRCALAQKRLHKIVLMVESGDLREGIMPRDLDAIIEEVLTLQGIELIGIGTNMACFGGVQPDQAKMELLSARAIAIEQNFGITLQIISGGNSANYQWSTAASDVGRINNLRLGESIFLGLDPLCQRPIPGLYTDAFTLVVEVTELKEKPYMPYGTIAMNAFGDTPETKVHEPGQRAILGIGLQDIVFTGLSTDIKITLLGGSSDHLVVNPEKSGIKVGDEVKFNLNYPALLSAMTSPYISKINLS